MNLKTIILGCFLCSTISYCQDFDLLENQLEKYADSMYYNNTDYNSQNQRGKIIDHYQDVLARFKDTSSHRYKTLLTKTFAAKALFLEYENEFDSAISYSKKAIKLLNTFNHNDPYLKGHIYKRYYKELGDLGRWTDVLEVAKETKSIFKDTLVDNHTLINNIEFDIGMAYGKFGDFTKVIEQYKRAIENHIKFNGEFTREAAIQEHHLAVVYGFIGYYKKELESYKKVINRWENIDDKDKSYLNIAYGSLCTWYLWHGDTKTAELYALKSEALVNNSMGNIKYWFNETFKGRTQLVVWTNFARLALQKKDTLQATYYNNKILNFIKNFDVHDKSNNPHNLYYSKNFVNLNHMKALRFKSKLIKSNAPEEAKDLLDKLLELEPEDEVATSTLQDKIDIVDYYINSGRLNFAEQKLNDYKRIATTKNSKYSLMCLNAKEAKIQLLNKHFDQMEISYTKVFKEIQRDTLNSISIEALSYEDCKPYGDKVILELCINASQDYNTSHTETGTIEDLEKAFNISVLSSNMFSENFSYLPFNEQSYLTLTRINENLLSTALLLNSKVNLNEVLETIEQTSSRLSWKKFLASKQRNNFNIPDSILERESNLKSELHFYKEKLYVDIENNEDKIKHYKKKLYDIQIEMESLEAWYNTNYPSYFNQTQKMFTLDGFVQKLKKKQCIIKYVIAEENIYAFIITSKTIDLIEVGSKKELNKKIDALISKLTQINSKSYKDLAKDLYTILLPKHIIESSKKLDLIFIQDDVLNFVPMEILLDSKSNYLIQSHSISYAPSLLLWEEQLNVKKSKNNKLGIFVPSYAKRSKDKSKRNDNTALLGANSEAIAIGNLFNSDIYSEEKATKQQFIKNAKSYNILHLAMHSNINDTAAEFSNLSFSTSEDDKLFISELYNIPLNADLAVLSACNTGSGTLHKGEGLTNVSKAFTYAGVPSIVMSLWEVPDKETSQIMVAFYKNLKEGHPKNEALRLAKINYLNTVDEEALKHPFYWAGFVISGDVSPIHQVSNRNYYVLAGGLLLAIVIFGILFKKRA